MRENNIPIPIVAVLVSADPVLTEPPPAIANEPAAPPELGRFISQDSIEYADYESVNGLNLYAYCNNDPVNNIDPMGTWS